MELTAASIRRSLLLSPLAGHKGRVLLSVVAIALGVALGYAVHLINRVAVDEFTQAVQALSGQADLVIRGPRAGFDEALYPLVAQLPEVAVASPVLELDVGVVDRREPLALVAVDVFRAAQVQPELVLADAGEALDFLRPDRIFLSAAAAEWLNAGAGDEIGVQVGLSEVPLRVAGIVRGASLRQRVGVMDIGAAQWRLERLGRINRIDLRLRPGADVDVFAARVQAQLPPGVVIERPADNVERGATMSRAYRVNLNVLALVALFTGGLLVFSTQALAIVQRRAQLALLRVLGMTGRQILGVLLSEALLVGGIGALAGIALGHVGAGLVIQHFGADLGAGQFRGLRPEMRVDLLGLLQFALLGLATAVAGSLAPALEAVRSLPAQALRAGDEQRMFVPLQPILPGVLVLVAATLLTQGAPVDGLPLFGYASIACFLVGTIMLMPRLAVVFFRIVPGMPAVPARLAVAQLSGAPGQAMISLAAIVASVSLMVSMAIMVTSFRVSLDEWLQRLLPADLYLRTGLKNEAAFLSPENQARVRAVPGVRRAEFMRTQLLLLGAGRPNVLLMARSIDRGNPEASIPLVGARLAAGAGDPPPLWASEAVADLYGYRIGNIVELPVSGERTPFVVAGIWRDYARQQGSVVIERDVYMRLTGDRNVNDGALWLDPGTGAAQVMEAIRASLPGGLKLDMAESGQIRQISLRVFDRTFAVTYGLEAVAVIIGLFALSSSFGALVLSRRREFGMLRHLPWSSLGAFAAVMLGLAVLTALASGRRAMGDDAVRAVKEDW